MDTPIRCTLGITDDMLLDFRSYLLSPSQMERIQAHIGQCSACQARLVAFEASAHVPSSGSAQANSVITPSPPLELHAPPGRKISRSRSLYTWMARIFSILIVALIIGSTLVFLINKGVAHPATTTSTAPQVIHAGSLTWLRKSTPSGFPAIDLSATLPDHSDTSIVQGDSNTTYACQTSRDKLPSPHAWVTRNVGASLSIITPDNIPAGMGGCSILPDSNNAATVLISFYPTSDPQQPPPPSQWVTYASFDGGATWTKPAGINDGHMTGMLASSHGALYAIRTGYLPDGTLHTVLAMSSDHLRSWTPIDATLPETEPNPSYIHDSGKLFAMWVNPDTNEVLEETYAHSLWSTVNNGAHWTKIPFPVGVFTADPNGPLLTVGIPTTSARLTICGEFMSLQSVNETLLDCTTDDGNTWSARPSLAIPGSSWPLLSLVAIGRDGSIYAIGAAGRSSGPFPLAFYRLPPGATTTNDWKSLGTIPYSTHGAAYSVEPSGNIMAFQVFPSMTTTQGKTIVQPYYYVATYP